MGAFVLGRRPLVRAVVVAVSAIAIGGTWIVLGATTGAQATVTTLATFNSRGQYVWTVPNGVTKITFTAYGASGGNLVSGSPPSLISVGGAGGEAKGTFKVKPGETFLIEVGGHPDDHTGQDYGPRGLNGGGYGTSASFPNLGGAGGGGASDVRIGGKGTNCASGLSCKEFDRIIVAGGGGGAGQDSDGGTGGGMTGACASSFPCMGQQEGQQCNFGGGGVAIDGCFYWGGTSGPSVQKLGQGGGGGGWFGGEEGGPSGGGGGGSGYVSPLALKGSFPGGTHSGDGLVVITTP